MSLKIASWNLCLGLSNKRDLVLDELIKNEVDLCCLQDTELDPDYPVNLLNSRHYDYETENNTTKHRVGLYIKNTLKYKRREDLEKRNSHVIIVDLLNLNTVRIISLYRSFRPPNNEAPRTFFLKQLEIVRNSIIPNTIVLGDFNLDFEMQYKQDYPHIRLFAELNQLITDFN